MFTKTHFPDSSLLLCYIAKKFNWIIKGHSKFVSKAYLSNLFLDEDQMPPDLQPGDYTYWKRRNLKDYLQTGWKDPYQVLLTSSYTVKLKGINSWINFHSQRAPALVWPIEWTADLKITLKQRWNRGETTLTPGWEKDNIRSRPLTQPRSWTWLICSFIMFSWLLGLLRMNQMFFYHRHDPMLVLKINPVVGFVANYLCLVLLGYLSGFLLSKAVIGWLLGNLS